MDIPILTSSLVARLVQADNAFTLSRIKHVQTMPSNPFGVAVREFGHVLATLMTQHPENWWNRVGGLVAGDENLLDEITSWYRGYNIQPSFDITPPQASPELLRALAQRGFFQSGFRNVYYGAPQPPASLERAGGSAVVEQVPPDSILFFDLGRKNHFIPTGDFYLWRDATRAQFVESRCYIAYVDDEPAAHATMFVWDGIASFGFAGTLEQYRGRGCQTALLQTRIRDAVLSQCNLVTVQANPGTASARNIERAGLRAAYTKAIWSKF